MERGGIEYQYFGDMLGSITELIDRSTGEIRNRYHYSAFGETTLTPHATEGAIDNPFAYTGREWELDWPTNSSEDRSLYFYRARYYDPSLGRFLSEDPIGFAGGDVNLYAYLGSSPLVYNDPFGQTRPDRNLWPSPGSPFYDAIKEAADLEDNRERHDAVKTIEDEVDRKWNEKKKKPFSRAHYNQLKSLMKTLKRAVPRGASPVFFVFSPCVIAPDLFWRQCSQFQACKG